jgi:hypothetical protein
VAGRGHRRLHRRVRGLLALHGSHLMTATAIVLGGTAFVLVLAMVFYAVGRSEDRERAARESGPDGPAV